MEQRCSANVSRDAWHYGRCGRNAVVERDGKPYCKIHDPEYIEAKDRKRQAKYEANNCKSCGFHFRHDFYGYCPLCGTKRSK